MAAKQARHQSVPILGVEYLAKLLLIKQPGIETGFRLLSVLLPWQELSASGLEGGWRVVEGQSIEY